MTRTISGIILRGETFEPVEGRVVIEDGTITAIEEAAVEGSNIILPAFTNAHTHLGDSIAKEAGRGLTLEELVAPPDGLKHRLLRDSDPDTLSTAMRRSLQYMQAGGTAATIEFREGGVAGVEQLRTAAESLAITPVILGRESIAAMEAGDGFGASGANDDDFTAEREATATAGKLFGIHAGEVDASDVDAALDLEPDFIVHAVHLEDRHWERIADDDIPIVACPRSNIVTDAGRPPIPTQLEVTDVALGTDNVMLNSPSMFREMAFTAKLYDIPAPDVLAMATSNGARIAGREHGIIEPGRPAALQVLDGDSDNLVGVRDPVRAVVRRAGHSDVKDVLVPDK